MDDREITNSGAEEQRLELAGYLKHCARQDPFAQFEHELKAARDILVSADATSAFERRIVRALRALIEALLS